MTYWHETRNAPLGICKCKTPRQALTEGGEEGREEEDSEERGRGGAPWKRPLPQPSGPTAARCSATAGAAPEGACAPAYDPLGEDGDADERRDARSARTAEPAGREAEESLPSAGSSLPFPVKGTWSARDVADDVDAAYARRNALSAPAADPFDREGKGYLPPAGASLPSPAKGTGSHGIDACHDATAGVAQFSTPGQV